jgi:hypothetical protein
MAQNYSQNDGRPEPSDFEVVAKATYEKVKQMMDVQGNTTLQRVKALSKEEFFRQSKVVSKKWWNQTNGKSQGTATVMIFNFKAAQARLAAATGDDHL